MIAWLKSYGFALLVGAAIVAAAYLAIEVSVPSPVPDFALRAKAVYRIEIGAAAFAGFYLVAMAFVLALNGRAFSEIGVNGLKAQEIVNEKQQTVMKGQDRSIKALRRALQEIQTSFDRAIRQSDARIKALEERPGGAAKN